MGNLLDYLDWRGDIPFSVDPFNEVDNLILSEVAYTNFVSIPDDGTEVSLADACEEYFRTAPNPEDETVNPNLRKAGLMKKMIADARFRNTKLCFYHNELDRDHDVQFAAVTFLLEDGTAYAAFRGTDQSFIGLRDAMDLSYQAETESQHKAIEYLNSLVRLPDRPLRVGGHSKGGNFAVYGAIFCDPSVRDRITAIYSNDGPGFRDEIILSDAYRQILPKIISIIPNASIVGRLMLNASAPRIVRSSAIGIGQHDAFTWRVQRNHFEYSGISEVGVIFDKSVGGWADNMDFELRKSLVESIFTVLDGTGKETIPEVKAQKLKTLEAVLSGMNELPEEKRQELIAMIKNLIRLGAQNTRSEVLHLLEKTLSDRIHRSK